METKILKSINLIRCVSGASLNLFRYAAKSCDSQGVVTATSYGASVQHPLSIHSASDRTSRKAGGREVSAISHQPSVVSCRRTSLHLYRYAAMIMLLLSLGVGNAWGGNTYYSKLTAKSGDTARGLVYAATSNSDGAIGDYSNEKSSETQSSGTSQQEDSFYAFAKAARGSKFDSWTKGTGANSITSSGSATTEVKVKESSSNNGTNTGNVTASFSAATAYTLTFKQPQNFGGYTAEYANYTISNNKFTPYTKTITMTSSTSDNSETSYASDKVTLTATARLGNFLGWYVNGSKVSDKADGYTFNPSATCTIEGRWEEVQTNIPMHFKAVDQDDNNNYKGYYTVGSQTVQATDYNTTTGANYYLEATLTAHPADGYVFTGWYTKEGKKKTFVSYDNPYNAYFDAETTLYANFTYSNYSDDVKAQFKVGSNYYLDLNEANTAAGSNGTIVCTRDGILPPGNYKISGGVKLYIPYSTSESYQTTPEVVTTAETLSAYRTLTFAEGANVTVEKNGVICVGGKIMSAGGGSKSAYVTGPCGVINMANGGHIELNDGAKLYCWGFIKGQDMDQGNNTLDVGSVTANDGAIIYEDFEVGDWRGGTATSNIYNNSSRRVFPFQSYSIQNIEVPTTFKYGSTLNTYVVVNGGGGNNPASFDIIGSKNTLFLLKDAQSVIRMWYDPTTDLTCYELSGTAQLDALNIKVYISMSSSDYNLPISNSMHIIMTKCNMTLSKPMTMQAGSVIEIKEDATANLESNLYMFDKDDWGLYIHNYYFRSFNNLTSHKNRGAEDSNAGLEDAKLIVDGTLNITGGKGYLYSTTGGANVMGNGGGKVVFGGALASSGTLYQVTVRSDSPYINWVTNDINTANLCNEDGSYTKSIASTTFHNINGRWFAASAKEEKADHTYDFTYISSGAVSGTGGTNSTIDAVYSNDKTGLELQMKWANVDKTGQCPNWWLGMTDSYFYNWTLGSAWHQFIPTEIDNVYSGSNNQLYEKSGCDWNSIGETDENCLYTIGEVKKALVDGHFLELVANSNDPAFHLASDVTKYYICFAGCNWHEATKYVGENKAYIVDGGNFIWFEGAWLNVERQEPFFYTVDETNVKICYEYLNGDWVVAEPYVKVEDALETRKFYFLNEAITVASGKKDPTITILRDMENVTTSSVYTGKSTTCTLDLNGHIVNGTCQNLLHINGSGSTFTITDNTTNKKGELRACPEGGNARTIGFTVTAGTLKLEGGKLYSTNTTTRTGSTAETFTSATNTGVVVKANAVFTVTGGTVESEDEHQPYAVKVETSGTMNLSGTGEIKAHATKWQSTRGVSLENGNLNVSGGTITSTAVGTTVYGVVIGATASWNASKSTSSKSHGTLTMTKGTIFAESTNDVRGVQVSGAADVTGDYNESPVDQTVKLRDYGVANISGGSIIANATTNNTVYGVLSYGTTTISGGTITATVMKSDKNTAHGVRTLGGTTTISGTANVTANAPTKAYALSCSAAMDGTRGWLHLGVMNVNGGTFTANTTNTTTAYGLYVSGTATSLARTDSYKVFNGDYAAAGTVTVTAGAFYVNAKSTTATGIVVDNTVTKNEASATPVCTVNGGYFKMTGTGTLSGTNTAASADNFHINGGYYSHNGNLAGYVTSPKQVVTLPQNDANRPDYEYKVAEAYTVTFMNGENQLQSGYQEVGKAPVYDGETPTKGSTASQSYKFDGWSTTDGGDKLASLPNVTSAGATYYAHYETTALKYIVSLDATTNGGSCATDKIYVNPGTAVGTLPTATKTGYTFQGWYSVSAATGGTKLEATTTISADATYYARFTVNSYALTWNLDGGTVGTAGKYGSTSWPAKNATGSPSTNVPYGSALTAPVVARPGYTFKIWSPTVAATMPAEAATYTAQWTANTNTAYTVKHYQQNVDGTYPSTPTETESLKGTTATSVTPAVKSYDGFISPAVQTKTIAADGSMVVEYQYARMSYTVSLNATMNGGSCATSSVTVLHGGTISSLPAATKSGYAFTGWFTKAIGGTQITASSIIEYNIGTIYAQFEELVAYALSWDFAGGSTSSTTYTEAGDLYPGTAITYPANNTMARENYVFNGWSTDVTSMPNTNLSITAQWTPAVASVTSGGTTYYATLSEAITAAHGMSNATVTMLQDATTTSQIELTKTMTIDLNGKTVSSTLASATGVFKINASGNTVTITDSGTGGKIDHTANYNGKLYGIWLTKGSLKIERGTIYAENQAAANKDYRAYGIWTDGSASSITISGGLIEATSQQMSYGIYCGNSCAITMTGGEIFSHGTTSMRGLYTQGTTTLTDATIRAMAKESGCVFYAKQGTLTVNSGTYTASGAGSNYVFTMPNESQVGSITINGGLFNGATKEVNKVGTYGTVSISGGYYAHNTDLAGYCTANHYVFDLTAAEKAEVGNDYKYKVAEAYTVTFNANEHGTAPASQLIEKGKKATEPTAPTATGYTFGGWHKEVGCSNAWNFSSDVVTAATTLYAKWTVHTHKFAWDFAGGSTSSTTHTAANNALAYGSAISYPADNTMTKTGYTFASWSSSATAMPDEDLTITANWIANTNTAYTVKHYQQNLDGSYPSEPTETQNLVGTTATDVTPAVKNYAGFTAPAAQTVTILADGSRVVTYNYTRNSYTLSWVTDGDALTGDYTNGSVKYGASITAPNTPTKTGYTFAGWHNGTGIVTPSTMPAAKTTYTATWTINQYTLTVLSANEAMGTVTGGGTYDYNTVHEITATPKTGFKFVKWNDDNTENPRSVTIPAENVTYTATFDYDIANYTVMHWQQNINNDEYTEVTGDRQELSGTIGTFTAAAAKEYTGFTAQLFEQQKIVVGGNTINIYYNRDTYTITWIDDNNDPIETDENVKYGATPSYDGDTPTKTATAQYTFSFAGWTPDVVTVTGNATYKATFNNIVRQYTITWKDADGSDLNPASTSVQYGLSPYHTAPSKEYCTFTGWKAASSGSVHTGVLPTVGTGDVYEETYTAQYACELPTILVEPDKNISVINSTTTSTTTVQVNGTLEIKKYVTLTTDDLILEGSADDNWKMNSGEILLGEGTVTATNAYYDMSPDSGYKARIWYAVAVPWTVSVPKNAVGDVYDADGHGLRLNIDFDLLYYNGESRAQGGTSNWNSVAKDVSTEWVMKPGMAYMIYLANPTTKLRFKKSSGDILTSNVSVKKYDETTGNDGKDANWNGIANPALYHAYLNAGTDGNWGQVFVPGNAPRESGTYVSVDMSTTQLVVGQPVFVQAENDKSVVACATKDEAYPSLAPRRVQQDETMPNVRYAVELSSNGKFGDRIFVLTNEDKEDVYTIGQDVAKLGSSSTKPQMWVNRYDSKLCVNTMPLTAKKATYPLSISVPADGDYELYIANEIQEGQDLYVTYNNRMIWNLTYGPFTASLSKGTHTEYGLKLVQSPMATTGLEDGATINEVNGVRKVLIDNTIYIIREGVVYTINGQQVQ